MARKVIQLVKTAPTWQEQVEAALSEQPAAFAAHYRACWTKFAAFWASRGYDAIPDEADQVLENKGKAPSWRRFAKVLAYQDIHCSLIGFGPTKTSMALVAAHAA